MRLCAVIHLDKGNEQYFKKISFLPTKFVVDFLGCMRKKAGKTVMVGLHMFYEAGCLLDACTRTKKGKYGGYDQSKNEWG